MVDLFLADLGREETPLAEHQMPGLTSPHRDSARAMPFDYLLSADIQQTIAQTAVLIASVSSRAEVQSSSCNGCSPQDQLAAATIVSLDGDEEEAEGVSVLAPGVKSPDRYRWAAEWGLTGSGAPIVGRPAPQKRNQ